MAHKLDMADHINSQHLRRPAISLALSLGWIAVLVATIETLGRCSEALAQLTGFVAVILLHLMSVALLVRALAAGLVALLALLSEIVADPTPIREPVTA